VFGKSDYFNETSDFVAYLRKYAGITCRNSFIAMQQIMQTLQLIDHLHLIWIRRYRAAFNKGVINRFRTPSFIISINKL